jgi:hypothetical protein
VTRECVVEEVSKITPSSATMIWGGRLAYRGVTDVSGDPGIGKSLLTCLVASTITQAGYVTLFVNTEDDPRSALVPRLTAVKANLKNVKLVRSATDEIGAKSRFSLPSCMSALGTAIAKTGARLVVIDPLFGFLDPDVDPNTERMRAIVDPLNDMAQRYACSIIVVRHLNKNQMAAKKYRASGSISVLGGARSALLLEGEPHRPGFIVKHVKCSNGLRQPDLPLEVVTVPEGYPFLRGRRSGAKKTKLAVASQFLEDQTKKGASWKKIVRRWKKQGEGFAKSTLYEARRRLKVSSPRKNTKSGKKRVWKREKPPT